MYATKQVLDECNMGCCMRRFVPENLWTSAYGQVLAPHLAFGCCPWQAERWYGIRSTVVLSRYVLWYSVLRTVYHSRYRVVAGFRVYSSFIGGKSDASPHVRVAFPTARRTLHPRVLAPCSVCLAGSHSALFSRCAFPLYDADTGQYCGTTVSTQAPH